jgi:hypothetical protein
MDKSRSLQSLGVNSRLKSRGKVQYRLVSRPYERAEITSLSKHLDQDDAGGHDDHEYGGKE